jgi:TrmH RNA methyltransferase
MPNFSRPDPRSRPALRPAVGSDEFVAPTGAMRPRGSTEYRGVKPSTARAPLEAAPERAAGGASGENDAIVAAGMRSGPARHDELKLCGLAAVKARFTRDPGSIKRLFFDHETGQRVGLICKALAQQKKIYRQVEPAELEKIAGSIHHGGIVAVVYAPPLRVTSPDDAAKWAKRGESVLVLDRIGNAHNLGAIARTAAFLGVARIVIPDHPSAARPSDSAHRVAEGGFEHLEVWQAKDLVALARELASAGYDVVGAATRGGRADAPREKGKERKPLALFLGNEEFGLAPEVAAACSRLVTIPGSGKVESLNVSVAAAVLLWELFARR